MSSPALEISLMPPAAVTTHQPPERTPAEQTAGAVATLGDLLIRRGSKPASSTRFQDVIISIQACLDQNFIAHCNFSHSSYREDAQGNITKITITKLEELSDSEWKTGVERLTLYVNRSITNVTIHTEFKNQVSLRFLPVGNPAEASELKGVVTSLQSKIKLFFDSPMSVFKVEKNLTEANGLVITGQHGNSFQEACILYAGNNNSNTVSAIEDRMIAEVTSVLTELRFLARTKRQVAKHQAGGPPATQSLSITLLAHMR